MKTSRSSGVRGFASPEGLRSPRYGFEGNDALSLRRAAAAVERLREMCIEHSPGCLGNSLEAESGGELLTLVESDAVGQQHETEGERLVEHAVAVFSVDPEDARHRTPDVQRELERAHTPAEKAEVVYAQLRRAEILLTRQVDVTSPASSDCAADGELPAQHDQVVE